MKKGNQTYKLPHGWKLVLIDEISIPSIKTNKNRNDIKGDFYYIDINSIDNGSFKIINPQKHDWNTAPSRAQQIIKTNNILFATVRPYLKNIALVNEKYNEQICSSAFCVIHPIVVNAKYIYYYVLSNQFIETINKLAKGTSYPAVTSRIVLNQTIPIAPIKEQQRIISKIETLFSELDQASKGLQKSTQQLEVYRQVILKNAFSNSIGKNSRLGDCVSKIGLRIKPDKKSKYKFIGLDSINPNSLKLHQIHEYSNFSSSGIRFNKGDILYSRMRPNLNKVYKAEFDGVCSGEFFVLKCSDSLNADFLKYLLHSTDFVGYATNKAKGDRPRLSYGDFALYEINLIPINKQSKIVEDIDSKFSLINNLENTINKSIKSIESTRNSILKQAFEGKLVLQEPTDESASKLLKRIKIEKEKYLTEQVEFKKKNPKKTIKMSKLLNIEDVLKTSKKPMLAKDVWQNSKHKNDIESFYAELKELGEKVSEIKEGLNSFLILKQ